jgi:hypothetical protein
MIRRLLLLLLSLVSNLSFLGTVARWGPAGDIPDPGRGSLAPGTAPHGNSPFNPPRCANALLPETTGHHGGAGDRTLPNDPETVGWGTGLGRQQSLAGNRGFATASSLGRTEVVDLVGGKLERLAHHAGELKRLFVGQGAFERACWFILTGKWEPRGYRAMVTLAKCPMIRIEAGELETTPDEIKRAYARARKSVVRSRQGRTFSKKAEALAFIAIEVGERFDAAQGFYLAVLERWRERAQDFGFSPDQYRTTEAVRKTLKRIEKAFAELESIEPRHFKFQRN